MFILKNHQSAFLSVSVSLLYKEKWVRNQHPNPREFKSPSSSSSDTLERRREGTAIQPAAFFS